MLADTLETIVQKALEANYIVEIAIGALQMARISELEHHSNDLIRFQYVDQGIDHFAPAGTLVLLRVRGE